MNSIIILIAMAFFMAAIVVSILSENTWKNVGIVYALLAIGGAIFGFALTL